MSQGTVIAICRSSTAGAPRECVGEGELTPAEGLRGDASSTLAGGVIRLLPLEQIERANRVFNLDARPGSFSEHLTVEGAHLSNVSAGDRLRIGEAILEVIRVGSPDAFVHINAYRGVSLLPQWGIYCQVIKPGHVAPGDLILHLPH